MYQKFDDFVQHYIFKYLDKINDRIDGLGESLNQTIDVYIDYIKNKYFSKTEDPNYDRN